MCIYIVIYLPCGSTSTCATRMSSGPALFISSLFNLYCIIKLYLGPRIYVYIYIYMFTLWQHLDLCDKDVLGPRFDLHLWRGGRFEHCHT